MKLASVLAELLLEHGWRKLLVPLKYICKKNSILQHIAIDILLDKICICPGHRTSKTLSKELGIQILGFRGNDYSDSVVIKKKQITPTLLSKCICKEALIQLAPISPIFIIDMSLWNLHYDDEKRELIEQLLITLNVVRQYLWDRCLIITNPCPEFLSMFSKATKGMRIQINIQNTSTKRLLEDLDLVEKAVVLDPYANEDLTDDEVIKFKVFIIGGILDKGNRMPRATTKLYYSEQLNELEIPRKRITLRGAIVGVPERINRIVQILLKNIIEGYSLEKAIVTSMTKSDKIMRILYEIQKAKVSKIDEIYLIERFSWLDISKDEVEEALKRIK
ncbi:MAG: hypothetical protein DRO15_02275 [Thermoprotei archaeon]|nr:MAG: hypothetical protein DRO15_02275 [Thermoprotei archaeon]